MTDKHTLVERLNAWADSGDSGRGTDPTDLRHEAATRITALEARVAELVERLHWREEALRHAQGRFLNINIALSSGGTKREAIGIADVGEDCCKMALAREELPVRIARATLAKHQEGEGNE